MPLLSCAPNLSTSQGIRSVLPALPLSIGIFLSCICMWYARQSWQHLDLLVYYEARPLLNAIFVLKVGGKMVFGKELKQHTTSDIHTIKKKHAWLYMAGTRPSPLPITPLLLKAALPRSLYTSTISLNPRTLPASQKAILDCHQLWKSGDTWGPVVMTLYEHLLLQRT